MKLNEGYAEVLGDIEHRIFTETANAINPVLEARQENNSCLNEDVAKMVCRLLNLFQPHPNIIDVNCQSIANFCPIFNLA